MPQLIKTRRGLYKYNLNVSVTEETYDAIKAAADNLALSMGEYLDYIVKKLMQGKKK